jgi:hypothetical protein
MVPLRYNIKKKVRRGSKRKRGIMKKGEQQMPQPLLVCFVALTQDVGIFSSRGLDETLLD